MRFRDVATLRWMAVAEEFSREASSVSLNDTRLRTPAGLNGSLPIFTENLWLLRVKFVPRY
jgi:hypothetical protein